MVDLMSRILGDVRLGIRLRQFVAARFFRVGFCSSSAFERAIEALLFSISALVSAALLATACSLAILMPASRVSRRHPFGSTRSRRTSPRSSTRTRCLARGRTRASRICPTSPSSRPSANSTRVECARRSSRRSRSARPIRCPRRCRRRRRRGPRSTLRWRSRTTCDGERSMTFSRPSARSWSRRSLDPRTRAGRRRPGVGAAPEHLVGAQRGADRAVFSTRPKCAKLQATR